MDITINGQNLEVKYSIRAMIVFEKLADKPFELKGVTDWYFFMYSCLLAGNSEITLDFLSFIDWVEENPKEEKKMSDYLTSVMKVDNQLMEETEGAKKK